LVGPPPVPERELYSAFALSHGVDDWAGGLVGLVPIHDSADPLLVERVADDIERYGVSAARGVVSPDRVRELSAGVDRALADDAEWYTHGRQMDTGRVVFLPRYGREFLDLLEDPTMMGPCDHILGSACTLYTMTTLCQPPGYPGRPQHVDTEYAVPGFTVGLGVMVVLDDFTLESGPTRFHPDVTVDEPDPEDFERRALRLEAPAGSVCWFHGRIWHDAMPNTTDRWRRAILMAVVRPWVRQRFDMARMVAHLDVASMSPQLRQKLGFAMIAPGSYEEFFLPDDGRREELLRRAAARGGDGPV
jgi:hypothetical protein